MPSGQSCCGLPASNAPGLLLSGIYRDDHDDLCTERLVRTRGAVLFEAPGSYEVTELELDDPRHGELRVRMAAAGLCHSDDHYATGDRPAGTLPWLGGHEGAGIVESVG